MQTCTLYSTDVSDEEWSFVAPDLTLLAEDSGQRRHPLREVFNALRWLAHAGAPWRLLPQDLPPWQVVYLQFRRWDAAGCFAALVADLRLPKVLAGLHFVVFVCLLLHRCIPLISIP